MNSEGCLLPTAIHIASLLSLVWWEYFLSEVRPVTYCPLVTHTVVVTQDISSLSVHRRGCSISPPVTPDV